MQTACHVFARLNRHACRWVVLVGMIAVMGVPPATAQEGPTCEEAIAAGEEAYLNTNFQEAINRVSACLDQQDVPENQAVRAYRLLSLAHLRLNELQQARAAIVNILGVRPDYEADPVQDPPEYVSLVSIVKQEVQPAGPTPADEEPAEDESTPFFKRGSTWLSILGSIAVGGVVTLLTLGQSGGGDDGGGNGPPTGPQPLPPPPGTPSGN